MKKNNNFIDILTNKRTNIAKNIFKNIEISNKFYQTSKTFEKANAIFEKMVNDFTHQNDYQYNPFDSGYFPDVKNKIEATKLYSWLQKMPKGAILHLHSSSMGSYANLVNIAKKFVAPDGNSFYYLKSLKPTFDKPLFVLLRQEKPEYAKLSKISPEDNSKLLELLIPDFKTMKRPVSSAQAWKQINPIFASVGKLIEIPEIGYKFYEDAFKYLYEVDNVKHVELRSRWEYESENQSGTIENMIVSAVNKIPKMSLKVIAATSRGSALNSKKGRKATTRYFINVADAIKNQKSKYLSAIDFVGQEDVGEATFFSYDIIVKVFENLNYWLPPTILHDGESSLPFLNLASISNKKPIINYENQNIIDAYILNTFKINDFIQTPKRIGHGLELIKSSYMMSLFQKSNLGVEICPVSNNYLGYVSDLRNHPGITYFTEGIPISINPDDPAIFGYQGVSMDFWFTAVSWGLNLYELRILTIHSIDISSLSEEQKKLKKQELLSDWNLFVNWIISQKNEV